jgi:hypothetical protein
MSSKQIAQYSAVSNALTDQSRGHKAFVPPKNNAPDSANHLDVYFLGDARARPPSSGEAWSEVSFGPLPPTRARLTPWPAQDEYRRLSRLTVQHPVTKAHRWKEISHALAQNPAPDDMELREVKDKEQALLIEKNSKVKDKEKVEFEQCYYW